MIYNSSITNINHFTYQKIPGFIRSIFEELKKNAKRTSENQGVCLVFFMATEICHLKRVFSSEESCN